MTLKLVKPSKKYLQAFLKAWDDYKQDTNRFKHVDITPLEKALETNNIDNYFKQVANNAKGINLKQGYVPSTTFWLLDDDDWVGSFSIRHQLTPKLEQMGGHIAVNISPKYRGKYSSFVGIKKCMVKAHKLGLKRVLMTCDENNRASFRAIMGLMKLYGGEQLPDTIVDGHGEHRVWVNTARK